MMPPQKISSRLAWTTYTAMTEKRWRSEYKEGSFLSAMRSTGQCSFFSARSAAFSPSSAFWIGSSTLLGSAERKCESVLR